MRHRGGAEAGRSRAQSRPPLCTPPGAHRHNLWRTLTSKTCYLGCGLAEGGLFHDVRPAVISQCHPSGKKSEHFCPNRIRVKVLQRYRRCAPGVSKGGGSGAGATSLSAPLAGFFWFFSCRSRKEHISTIIICKDVSIITKTYREHFQPAEKAGVMPAFCVVAYKSRIAAMYSGAVPQQPPKIVAPLVLHCCRMAANSWGVWA